MRYTGTRVKSTKNEIVPDVAMYVDFLNRNAERTALRIGPPVPINPAKNPYTAPPTTLFTLLGVRVKVGLNNERRVYPIKTRPNTNRNTGCETNVTSDAPRKVKTTLGTPNLMMKRRSTPLRKNVIRPILPARWNIETSARAVRNSKKRRATGNKILEIPNAAMVPSKAAKNATPQNTRSSISDSQLSAHVIYV
jgi:hypothetical protein